ncbi:MAG: ABC transporter ATP-binding protein [Wenzhouxiangellaceae bacterium]
MSGQDSGSGTTVDTDAAAAADVVIRVRGLDNRFGEQVVHQQLDLDVRRGEIMGVVGGSGSGKSVLLRSIVGLLRPKAGDIRMLDIDSHDADPDKALQLRRRIGVMFQDGALFSSLTVMENVAFAIREHYPLEEDRITELAEVKIVMAGLPLDAAHKYPSELSGGMRKRAGLARSLALDPELLFLDEPTAGLDPITAARFDQLLVTLRDALGLTVFLVTHDLDTLYSTCDRVAVLAQHKVLVVGTLSEVAQHPHDWIQEYFNGPRGRAAALDRPAEATHNGD